MNSQPAHASHAISPEEWQVRRDLAACYRLCAMNGWDDLVYTHISASVPGTPGHFLINEFGLAFDEISASSLVKISLEGEVVDGSGRRVNAGGFAIHAAVHAARPDAHCVLHLHNENAIAVGIQPQGLLPLSQHALRFFELIGYHDYEGLALTPAEQTRMVQALCDFPALLLRNHGSLVCGRTVAEAYVLLDTLDKACAIQLKALAGTPYPHQPPAPVCRKTRDQLLGDGSPEGVLEWPALLRRLERLHGDDYRN